MVERTFSAAADICTNQQGVLAPKTLECAVGYHLWFRGKVFMPQEDFKDSLGLVQEDAADKLKRGFKRLKWTFFPT